MDLGTLLQQGGLAALAVAEAVAILHLWRQLQRCQEERVAEKGAVVAAMHDQAAALSRVAEALDRLSGRLNEEG